MVTTTGISGPGHVSRGLISWRSLLNLLWSPKSCRQSCGAWISVPSSESALTVLYSKCQIVLPHSLCVRNRMSGSFARQSIYRTACLVPYRDVQPKFCQVMFFGWDFSYSRCLSPIKNPTRKFLTPIIRRLCCLYRHPGSFDIVSVKDGAGHVFATRLQNIFTMGHGTRTMVRFIASG